MSFNCKQLKSVEVQFDIKVGALMAVEVSVSVIPHEAFKLILKC